MASKTEYAQWIVENQDKKGTPEFETVARAYQALGEADTPADTVQPESAGRPQIPQDDTERSLGQRIAGSSGARLLSGAAAPFVGAFQLGAEAGDVIAEKMGFKPSVGDAVTGGIQKFREFQESGRMRPNTFDLPRTVGNIGATGAAVSKIPQASNYLTRILQGGAIGAGAGAVQPVESGNFGATKTGQTALGAVLGGAVPAVSPLVRAGVERFTQAGGERAAGRLANQAAGDRRPEIVQILKENRNPMGQGTAGEVAAPAGSAEFSALQRSASQVRPSEYADIAGQQNNAITQALRGISGSADDMAAAQARRSATAGQRYGEAFGQSLDDAVLTSRTFGNPVVKAKTETIENIMNSPYIRRVIPKVEDMANTMGVKKGTTQYYHLVKKGLDDLISSARGKDSGLGPNELAAVRSVKSRFLNELENINPLYAQARQQFADDSVPINQMQVGQYVSDKLSPALREYGDEAAKLRAPAFAQAMRDAPGTIKRSTGESIYQNLDDIMTPQQMETFGRIGQDLARRARFTELAKAGSSRGNDLIANLNALQLPNALTRPIMVINAVLRRTGSKASERTLDILAKKMQNPQEMARIMEAANPSERAVLQRILQAGSATEGAQAVDASTDPLADALVGGNR